MQTLVLQLSRVGGGIYHITSDVVPLCDKHFKAIMSTSALQLMGTTEDPCYHCAIEWTDKWKHLIATNADWLTEIKKDDSVYIAGPMTGLPEKNIPAFNLMGHALKLQGANVYNPASLDQTKPYPWLIRQSMIMLTSCYKVVFLRGWEKSTGGDIEHRFTVAAQYIIYYEKG